MTLLSPLCQLFLFLWVYPDLADFILSGKLLSWFAFSCHNFRSRSRSQIRFWQLFQRSLPPAIPTRILKSPLWLWVIIPGAISGADLRSRDANIRPLLLCMMRGARIIIVITITIIIITIFLIIIIIITHILRSYLWNRSENSVRCKSWASPPLAPLGFVWNDVCQSSSSGFQLYNYKTLTFQCLTNIWWY